MFSVCCSWAGRGIRWAPVDAPIHSWCLFKPEYSLMRSWTHKQQGKSQGTNLGSLILAAVSRKQAEFHWEQLGQGWSHSALQSLCSAAGGVQGYASCVRKSVVPACCRNSSQVFSPLLVAGLDGTPSGLTLFWLLLLLEMLWDDFCSILPSLGKVWACCYTPSWEDALQWCLHWSLPGNPIHLLLCLSSFLKLKKKCSLPHTDLWRTNHCNSAVVWFKWVKSRLWREEQSNPWCSFDRFPAWAVCSAQQG